MFKKLIILKGCFIFEENDSVFVINPLKAFGEADMGFICTIIPWNNAYHVEFPSGYQYCYDEVDLIHADRITKLLYV